MKAKFFLPVLLTIFIMTACNNNNPSNEGTSPGVDDTLTNPTNDAMDYHPDQRQKIPTPDSSNTIGTDTINGTMATPNTGTNESFNAQKEDSSKK